MTRTIDPYKEPFIFELDDRKPTDRTDKEVTEIDSKQTSESKYNDKQMQ